MLPVGLSLTTVWIGHRGEACSLENTVCQMRFTKKVKAELLVSSISRLTSLLFIHMISWPIPSEEEYWKPFKRES